MKSRKTSQNKLNSLQETYNLAVSEINNLKLEINRTNIEFETLKTRVQEYKDICDNQNETIITLEKEKGAKELKENMECTKCLELKKLNNDFSELDYRFTSLQDKLVWYEKEINDKEKGITECKKQVILSTLTIQMAIGLPQHDENPYFARFHSCVVQNYYVQLSQF